MRLFQRLFGRNREPEPWDEVSPSAGEQPEIPAEAEPESSDEGKNAFFESISSSIAAHMMDEQSPKNAPVRVTPVPVSRRTASSQDEASEQTEPAAEESAIAPAAQEQDSSSAAQPEIQAEYTEPDAPDIAVPEQPIAEADEPEERAPSAEPDSQSVPAKSESSEAPEQESEESVCKPDCEPPASPKKSRKKSAQKAADKTEQRIVLKLHGTSKPHCMRALENCFTGQHVFISYDSKRVRCFVYTEEGEEIGRLSKRDSRQFAKEYDTHIHSTYITKIKKEDDNFRVKLLLLIPTQQPFSTGMAFFK